MFLICSRTRQNSSIDVKQTESQTPEGLWVDVGQLWVAVELEFDHIGKILEGEPLHYQKLFHIVETEDRKQ